MNTTFQIEAPDASLRPRIQAKIDHLNKPLGSLGRLEELAMQVCLVQQTLSPSLHHPVHLLLGADHGIEREGVSVSPRCVTWQQMINFTRGGGGVNMFCRQHGFHLRLVDVGVDHDLSAYPDILPRKIAAGTADFLYGPAMTDVQYEQALQVGIALVDEAVGEGCQLLSIGEMGIGNTSPSSLWLHLLAGVPIDECIGAGAGLDTAGIRRKRQVLSAALDRYHQWAAEAHPTVPQQLAYFGGFELVAALGAMLRAAECHLLVLVDGFIMTACALAACTLYPATNDYLVFTHCGDERAHRLMLQHLQARPLLQLGLRLGEGTGALCAFPLIDSAVRMVNEMNNFDNAHITKYF